MSINSKHVLEMLREIDPFPSKTRHSGRQNILQPDQERVMGFAIGTVCQLDEGMVPSRFNSRFPKLLRAARALMRQHDPNFKFQSIQVNKNQRCAPHYDINNKGPSYIIGLGNYTGGALAVTDSAGVKRKFDIKNKFVQFDGRNLHETMPFRGERYSLVFFTLKKRVIKNPTSKGGIKKVKK